MKKLFTLLMLAAGITCTYAQQWNLTQYLTSGTDTARYGNTFKWFGNNLYCGTNVGLFKSTNDGQSWQDLSNSGAPTQGQNIRSAMEAASGDLYMGSDKSLFKSTNGGSNWRLLTGGLPDSAAYYDIIEAGSNIVVAYATGFATGGAYYSSDTGASWTNASGLAGEALRKLFVDGATLYAAGHDGVYKSTDNGQTWTVAGTGLSSVTLGSMVKSGNAYFTGDITGKGLYGSFDSAATWAKVDSPDYHEFCQVFSIVESGNQLLTSVDGVGCRVVDGPAIRISTDAGTSLSPYVTGLPTGGFYPILGRNTAGTCFYTFLGFKGAIYSTCNATGIQATKDSKYHISVSPNPFSDFAVLRFEDYSAMPDKTELDIYDVVGECIKHISNLQAETILNKNEMPAGIYFCQIKAGKQILATKKVVTQ